ncbi:MAG: glycosyltransferase [Actinomycetes bacterium]
MSDQRPLVLITVGTDHHPFARLIGWVDRWLARHGDRVDAVVQHGTARPPRFGRAVEYLEHAEFLRLAGSAQIVVCHGGPATIAEVRKLGHLPIVVPRRPDQGEHVDDHQMRFTERLSARGLVRVPRDEDEFWKQLDAGIVDPMTYELPIDDELPVAVTVRRFGDLVAALPHRTRRR